jgi:RimJ/RimL family protein N-acetyltransferase
MIFNCVTSVMIDEVFPRHLPRIKGGILHLSFPWIGLGTPRSLCSRRLAGDERVQLLRGVDISERGQPLMTESQTPPSLRTQRLILREWRDDDLEPFVTLSMDPEVMQYLTRPRERAEVERWVEGVRAHFRHHSFGLWALEIPGITPIAGFTGLTIVPYEAHFTPAVEIAWRLARECWGNGYVTEAAAAALNFAFSDLHLEEIVANAAVANRASIRVMERMGMMRNPHDDFDHPLKSPGDPLRRQVLYRLTQDMWLSRRGAPG